MRPLPRAAVCLAESLLALLNDILDFSKAFRGPWTHGTESPTVRPHLRAVFMIEKRFLELDALVDIYTDEHNNDVLLTTQEKWLIGKSRRLNTTPLGLLGAIGEANSGKSAPTLAMQWNIAMKNISRVNTHAEIQDMVTPPYKGLSEHTLALLLLAAKFCRGLKYYGASEFTSPGSCPVSFELEEDKGRPRMLRPGGHSKLLYDMYLAKEAADRKPYQQFLDIVGSNGLKLVDDLIFQKVETSSVENSVRVGGRIEQVQRSKILVVPQFQIGKQKLSPNQLSEGTFKTLALVFYVVISDSTAMLIEEPEVCVHLGLLSSILDILKTYSRNKMIIISTHSDFVLAGC
jgi:AAA domain, putative AbiEii toxin, Type IV TA system